MVPPIMNITIPFISRHKAAQLSNFFLSSPVPSPVPLDPNPKSKSKWMLKSGNHHHIFSRIDQRLLYLENISHMKTERCFFKYNFLSLFRNFDQLKNLY